MFLMSVFDAFLSSDKHKSVKEIRKELDKSRYRRGKGMAMSYSLFMHLLQHIQDIRKERKIQCKDANISRHHLAQKFGFRVSGVKNLL